MHKSKETEKFIERNFDPEPKRHFEDFLNDIDIKAEMGEKIHFFSVIFPLNESKIREMIDNRYTLCMNNFRDKKFVVYKINLDCDIQQA